MFRGPFTINFDPTIGIDLPAEYQADAVTDFERYTGKLLTAHAILESDKGVSIFYKLKIEGASAEILASNIGKNLLAGGSERKVSTPERVLVNGVNAWRFEYYEPAKGLFGTDLTYLYTVIEGDSEIMVVLAWTKTSAFEKERGDLAALSEAITGLKKTSNVTSLTPASAASAMPVVNLVKPAVVASQASAMSKPTVESTGGAAQ